MNNLNELTARLNAIEGVLHINHTPWNKFSDSLTMILKNMEVLNEIVYTMSDIKNELDSIKKMLNVLQKDIVTETPEKSINIKSQVHK